MRAVCVPTNRPESIQEWLRAWAQVADWDRTYLVVDGPETLKLDIPSGMDVVQTCWADYERELGPAARIISRRDSACRSFGFWRAWRDSAEWIGSMDDDTFPADLPWFGGHIAAMESATRWFRTVDDVRPRGLPYFNQGKLDVRLNHGLWNGVPDLDAPHGLAVPRSDYVAPIGTRIVPQQQMLPLCGMNLCFHGSVLPLVYFAPMGSGQPFRRMDDIFCGILLARCFRALGWSIASGVPRVEHRRASNPMANLEAEAAGIAFNERLWEDVDSMAIDGSSPASAILSIAMVFAGSENPYLKHYGDCLLAWERLIVDSKREAA